MPKGTTKASAEHPFASIVVPAYNNRVGLQKVVQAMLELEYQGQYEVLVVNAGSTAGTREMLEREFGGMERVRLFHLPRLGVCRARNTGIRAAKGELVFNMDHDCIPARNWLARMVEGFTEGGPQVGVVTGYGGYGGTSTGFRKKLLDQVGGYDEEYFFYREDTDLAFKIMDLGYGFRQVDAPYFHDHHIEAPKSFLDSIGYGWKRVFWHKNDVLLWKKHPTRVCAEFLHVKFGFLVDPAYDFGMATGQWKDKGKFALSSPRGIVFLENKGFLHAFAIALLGLAYVVAVKLVRLYGSIRFGKLLI